MKKLLEMSDSAKKKYAELFMNALTNMEQAKWMKPWVQPHNGVACNLYRKDKPYRGVNDFLLNLLVELSGWNTPYFVTMKQMDDENLKYSGLQLNKLEPKFDKDGMPLFDKDGNLRYKCEESFPVFKYLPYVKDKDGNIITLEQYDALTDEEKEGCKMRFNLRVYPVWNIDQTDFKEKYPDAYKEMTETPAHDYEEMQRDEGLERMITLAVGFVLSCSVVPAHTLHPVRSISACLSVRRSWATLCSMRRLSTRWPIALR